MCRYIFEICENVGMVEAVLQKNNSIHKSNIASVAEECIYMIKFIFN